MNTAAPSLPPVPPALPKKPKGAVPPPLPRKPLSGPTEDPTWWRMRYGIPFIVLLLAAAAADYGCPLLCIRAGSELPIGFGTALGTLFFVAALLLLRKDYSCGERLFLILLAIVTSAAQSFSGSTVSWIAVPIVCWLMLLIPHECAPYDNRARSWWSFWLARRPDAAKAKAISTGCLPLCISIAVALALFFGFLAIFAAGNPVVKLAWELICEYWNKILDFLHLDMSIWQHVLVWFLGATAFGVFTFARSRAISPAAPAPAAAGKPLLPHLPSFALTGINAAFGIATSTDIVYLWFRRIPEGISQTEYLHHGAQSIIIASVLAAGLLLVLFRPLGSARQSLAARILGHLLVFQTALLAVSVFMRLFFQIDDYGFTGERVLALEYMLGGVAGIGLLLSYLGSGSFLKHLRLGTGTLVLLFFTCNIQPPKALAGDLNLCFVDTHPHWSFATNDFIGTDACFRIDGSLAFADKYMTPHDIPEMSVLLRAAEDINSRHNGTWRNLCINAIRFRELAAAISVREREQIRSANKEQQERREALRRQIEEAERHEAARSETSSEKESQQN